MKRFLTLLAIPMVIALLVTPVMAQESLPFTTDLIADGRDTALDVGDLTVNADGTIVFQIDEAATQWRLAETHVYVGDEPPSKSAPGKFPSRNEELGGVATDVHTIDLAAADIDGDGIVYVAVHAGLVMEAGVDPETGEIVYAYETAWATGDQAIGKGSNWATYFSVSLSDAVAE